MRRTGGTSDTSQNPPYIDELLSTLLKEGSNFLNQCEGMDSGLRWTCNFDTRGQLNDQK